MKNLIPKTITDTPTSTGIHFALPCLALSFSFSLNLSYLALLVWPGLIWSCLLFYCHGLDCLVLSLASMARIRKPIAFWLLFRKPLYLCFSSLFYPLPTFYAIFGFLKLSRLLRFLTVNHNQISNISCSKIETQVKKRGETTRRKEQTRNREREYV